MTKTPPAAPKTYHLHRTRQRRRILDAAAKLFDRQGISQTTMAEVMTASGLRASTLYEYFSTKDDIVWELFSEVLEEHAASAAKSMEGAPNGLGKIIALLRFMAEELVQHPARVRFMAQFDAMYARNWPVERLLTTEGRFNADGFKAFAILIGEGIADGSLRPDLDPELTLHAVINAVIGAQRRFASLGQKVELEYGHSIGTLFDETIRIVILGLSSTTEAQPSHPARRAKARRNVAPKRSL